MLELRGKLVTGHALMTPGGLPFTAAVPEAQSDILNALLALGYNEKEAAAAMKPLPADIGVSEGIRQALKGLARG